MLFTENLNLNMPEDGDQYDQELFNQNSRTIDKKAGTVDGKLSDIFAAIGEVNAKIPAQANPENQLADKDFVNSSIATNTANFIGTFDSVDALNSYSGTLTNNDYAFVTSVDEAGNTLYSRHKYNEEERLWKFEYALNNTGFTAEQMAAINSGATRELIDKLKQLIVETESVPVATIITSVAETAPDGYLLCDGSIYAQSQYPALYAAIGEKYNREGTSEGFFCVPDLRELVLVGSGQNTFHSIESHDVFEVGEFKDDQLQNITGELSISSASDTQFLSDTNGAGSYTQAGALYITRFASTKGISDSGNSYSSPRGFSFDASRIARTGITTHTKQFGINYYIKF